MICCLIVPAKKRVLVTIDKDFGELVFVQGKIHLGLIRLIRFRASEQGTVILRLVSKYEQELTAGAILTVEPWRVRLRVNTTEK